MESSSIIISWSFWSHWTDPPEINKHDTLPTKCPFWLKIVLQQCRVCEQDTLLTKCAYRPIKLQTQFRVHAQDLLHRHCTDKMSSLTEKNQTVQIVYARHTTCKLCFLNNKYITHWLNVSVCFSSYFLLMIKQTKVLKHMKGICCQKSHIYLWLWEINLLVRYPRKVRQQTPNNKLHLPENRRENRIERLNTFHLEYSEANI